MLLKDTVKGKFMAHNDSQSNEEMSKEDKKRKIDKVAKAFNTLVKGATAASLGLGLGSAVYGGARAVHEYVDQHDISNFPDGGIRDDIKNRGNDFAIVTRDSYGGYTVNRVSVNYVPGQPIELGIYPNFYDKDGKPVSTFVAPQTERFDNAEELRQRIAELTEGGIVYLPLPEGPRS